MEPYRYYCDKWDGLWDRPKYQAIREKILKSFDGLTFQEEGHKYFLHGKEIECVSNVVDEFVPPKDTDAMALGTFQRNFDNPDSKYYQMTVEQIKEEWKRITDHACSHGTERHEFSEGLYYFSTHQLDGIPEEFKCRVHKDEHGGLYYEALYEKEKAACKFYEDLPQCYIPILAETKVYNEELEYSGTFDLLVYFDATVYGLKDDSKSGLVVLDWKTNKNLYKNYNQEKMLPPFEGMLDMPLSHYKLQLSLYSLALMKIGFRVVGRRLMWLLPNANYDKIKLEPYMEQIERALINKIRTGKRRI